jgi:L-alanine-DL-glutamate epimerase-like enolase superfamily enzyme
VALATAFERVELDLDAPFTISRGTTETAENVVVRVSDGEHTGVGAAAPSRHYGETAATVEAVLPELLSVVEAADDPFALDRIERELAATVADNPAARAGVSVALHDLVGKRLDVPLYRLWGLDPAQTPETSYTVGLAEPDRMAEKAERAADAGFSTLKVKLGAERDVAAVEAVREAAPDATIRVDANEAWTPREAVATCERLAECGVEFVEQPVPADDPEGQRFVYEHAPLPVAADESCVTLADVPAVADRADIANLKLTKCGGPRHARRMVHAARAHGLAVMLGCMVASNAAIAAACHLAPAVDYADLDGSLLLAEDPFDGPDLSGGEIRLDPRTSGTGARETE